MDMHEVIKSGESNSKYISTVPGINGGSDAKWKRVSLDKDVDFLYNNIE